jgi:hypothetical protein
MARNDASGPERPRLRAAAAGGGPGSGILLQLWLSRLGDFRLRVHLEPPWIVRVTSHGLRRQLCQASLMQRREEVRPGGAAVLH